MDVSAQKTYIAVILDRSSSMLKVREETISGFNKQVEAVRAAGDSAGQVFVSLTTFADDVRFDLWRANSMALNFLNGASYQPHGNTAMNDAIGKTISRLMTEPADDNTAYLVVVVTDGDENKSQHFSGPAASALISELQRTGKWTFTVAGANIDLAALSHTLSIPMGNTVSWVPTQDGAQTYWTSNASATKNFMVGRSRGLTATADFYDKK